MGPFDSYYNIEKFISNDIKFKLNSIILYTPEHCTVLIKRDKKFYFIDNQFVSSENKFENLEKIFNDFFLS